MRRLLPPLFTHNFPLAKLALTDSFSLARLSKLNVNIYFYLHLAACECASVSCVCMGVYLVCYST